MPIGPRGEKRPKNPNAAAVMVGKIATGRAQEQYVDGKPTPKDERESMIESETDDKKRSK
ncbi:MAG: hypothetical protein OXF79_17255 [Chloroflexi bacterium]|nr:hypothetical protein [Chloroflexota bacterium]